ncbi:hypothetical protein [Cupriavidus sp. a3]|uniref:hypothetical protein n=1 Tax=Cupriavidus sp. a3 TaxID=3242158 RepID=UPI003D9C36DC
MVYLFALPPKVEVVEDPSTGSATITWYESSLQWRTSNRTILALNSPPWHQIGVRPFAWDYFELEWAHLRLAVARGVTVTQRTGPPGREQNVPIGWNALDPKRYPQVHLHRCQDEGLLGDPDETLDWYSIIGQPQRIEQEKFLLSLTSNDDAIEDWKKQQKAVQVTPGENAVTFQQIDGFAKVDVTLSNPGNPSAYCYDVRPEEWMEELKEHEFIDVDPSSTVIRIVHTRDVKIRLRAHEDQKDALIVEACEVSRLSDVPPQGAALGKADFPHLRFRRHAIDELIPSNRQPWVIALFELAINFIPVVGVVYDLGQLAYAAATGKTFFGYNVSEEELLLMGITTAIGLGVSAAGVRSLRKIVQGTRLEAATEDATLSQIRRIADAGYVEAVGHLPPRQWDDLLSAFDRHLRDPIAFPLPKLVDKFTNVVNDAYLVAVERRVMRKVFKPDFTGFRDADLAAAYNRYLQPKLRKKLPALDPASWAKKANRGLPKQLLRRALGDEFVEVINRAERADVLPRRLTKKHIDAYDFLVARGVEDYGTLRNLRNNLKNKVPDVGKIFEIDHLLEQRFWRNNPNLTTAFDEKGLGMAFVVPKNPAVSREMFIMAGGQRIRYVHNVKTNMLKELIPNGAETLVTVQEMWDAHVHVLRSLGTHESLIKGRLVKDFRLMAKQLGQSLDTRFPRPGAMRHTGGWPRFVEDPTTGAWTRL